MATRGKPLCQGFSSLARWTVWVDNPLLSSFVSTAGCLAASTAPTHWTPVVATKNISRHWQKWPRIGRTKITPSWEPLPKIWSGLVSVLVKNEAEASFRSCPGLLILKGRFNKCFQHSGGTLRFWSKPTSEQNSAPSAFPKRFNSQKASMRNGNMTEDVPRRREASRWPSPTFLFSIPISLSQASWGREGWQQTLLQLMLTLCQHKTRHYSLNTPQPKTLSKVFPQPNKLLANKRFFSILLHLHPAYFYR